METSPWGVDRACVESCCCFLPVFSPVTVVNRPQALLICTKKNTNTDFLAETEKWSESKQQTALTSKKGTNTRKKASRGLQERKKPVCEIQLCFLTIYLFVFFPCVHVCLPLSICTLIHVALSFIPLRPLTDVMWPDGQKFRGKRCYRNKNTPSSFGTERA